MWDLAVIVAMNEKAYQEYLKKLEKKKKEEKEARVA